MLLREKFTEKELSEAMDLVSNNKSTTLIKSLSAPSIKRSAVQRDTTKRNENGLSSAVQELEEKDPKRYALLAEFEKKLRQEAILPTLDDVRKVGISSSKEFQAGKSRKETIPRLMTTFATMPFDMLQEKLGMISDEAHCTSNDDNSYQKLAQFLINGSQNDSQHH